MRISDWSSDVCSSDLAVEHQYLVTEPIPGMPANLPTLRDPDRLVYYKPDAGGRLVIGGYEDDTVPFGERGIPGAFARQLLPENFGRFEPLARYAGEVTTVVKTVGVAQLINEIGRAQCGEGVGMYGGIWWEPEPSNIKRHR